MFVFHRTAQSIPFFTTQMDALSPNCRPSLGATQGWHPNPPAQGSWAGPPPAVPVGATHLAAELKIVSEGWAGKRNFLVPSGGRPEPKHKGIQTRT